MRTLFLRCFKINTNAEVSAYLRYLIMKYSISFAYADGSIEPLKEFECVDLDYWNIRQYRLVLTRFNKKLNDQFCTLLITPKVNF